MGRHGVIIRCHFTYAHIYDSVHDDGFTAKIEENKKLLTLVLLNVNYNNLESENKIAFAFQRVYSHRKACYGTSVELHGFAKQFFHSLSQQEREALYNIVNKFDNTIINKKGRHDNLIQFYYSPEDLILPEEGSDHIIAEFYWKVNGLLPQKLHLDFQCLEKISVEQVSSTALQKD